MLRGYTLVEIIITFVIFSISFVALYTSIGLVQNIYRKIKEEKVIEKYEIFTVAAFAENLKQSKEIRTFSYTKEICRLKKYKKINYTLCDYLLYHNSFIAPMYKSVVLKEVQAIIRVIR